MSKQGYVYFDPMDVQPNKVPAALAYCSFFAADPLPFSPFVKYHAIKAAAFILGLDGIDSILRWSRSFPGSCRAVFTGDFRVAVFRRVNALNGRAEPLPVIVSIRFGIN
jgi:hypothetical protein